MVTVSKSPCVTMGALEEEEGRAFFLRIQNVN